MLRAYFPSSIETHSLVQDFFFGEELMLRRHDYTVNIAGGFAASQATFGYGIANGITCRSSVVRTFAVPIGGRLTGFSRSTSYHEPVPTEEGRPNDDKRRPVGARQQATCD